MVASRNSLPADALAAVLEHFLASRLTPDKPASHLCVALSGGMDSVVLLHALRHRPASLFPSLQLSAVHVHHGLSANADCWADFCAGFCRDCAVPLDIVRVQVPRESGEGVEGAARRQRYAVFARCQAEWLALAQHRDDQAETVLLNLLRGAGVAGAAAMPPERKLGPGLTLLRPLLDVPRRQIEAYALAHGLRWVSDESNDDRHFRRNFLRHDILPPLEKHFPAASTALVRAAGHFAEAATLLDELARSDAQALTTPAGRIALPGFQALSLARARNLLRYLWQAAGFRAPETRWLEEALKQLRPAAASPEFCLETVDGQLRAYRGELYFVAPPPPLPTQPVRWQGEAVLPWGGGQVRFEPVRGQGIRRSLMDSGVVELRQRQGGERLQIHPLRPRRSLRKLLQNAAIPAWERESLPLLWCQGRLAWVGGLGVEASLACASGEAGILPRWEEG